VRAMLVPPRGPPARPGCASAQGARWRACSRGAPDRAGRTEAREGPLPLPGSRRRRRWSRAVGRTRSRWSELALEDTGVAGSRTRLPVRRTGSSEGGALARNAAIRGRGVMTSAHVPLVELDRSRERCPPARPLAPASSRWPSSPRGSERCRVRPLLEEKAKEEPRGGGERADTRGGRGGSIHSMTGATQIARVSACRTARDLGTSSPTTRER